MPDVLVRNVFPVIVNVLKKRAGPYGRSSEAEHQLILIHSFLKLQKDICEVLQIPNARRDSDFRRAKEPSDADIFDWYHWARKERRAHARVQAFFQLVTEQESHVYLNGISIGEWRRGIENVRHRDNGQQGVVLEKWVKKVCAYSKD